MTVPQPPTFTTTSEGIDHPQIGIEGIDESVIITYFQRLNAGDYAATVALFAENGVLSPPFGDPIVGRSAIATYLATEAVGIQLFPQVGERLAQTDDRLRRYRIVGGVQVALFVVKTAWEITLNQTSEVTSVTVQVLESLEKLIEFKSQPSELLRKE